MEEDIENNSSMEADNGQSFLEGELEALQAIYVHEVKVVHNEKTTSVSIDLHPATADKLDEQYVMMTLKFTLDEEYPHNIPEINIRNPRGLSDEKLNSIIQDLKCIAEGKVGNSMMFEIIAAAKEHLTVDNHPCGECAICLYGFSDKDVFTKTECYHYFHSHCLARYSKTAMAKEIDGTTASEVTTSDKNLLCPVCRLPIRFDGCEDSFPPPSPRDEDCVIGEDVLEIQKKMADLFQKQVDKGGIIDLEAEKNKYLLEISNVPTRTAEDAASGDLLGKTEEGAVSQSHGEREKDTNLDPNSSSRAVSAEGKTKKLNKQTRNNTNTNRTNKRYDNSKPKYDKDRAQKDLPSPSKSAGSDEACDNPPDSAPKTPGGRSEANAFKRNERRNNYGPPRRYYDDDYGRGNYHRYPESRGGNRGRRYPPNGYDRRNFRDHGYRGRGGRSYSEREASADNDSKIHLSGSKGAEGDSRSHHDNTQNDSKGVDSSAHDAAACEETKEQNPPDFSRDGPRNGRDNFNKNRQYPRKKYSDRAYNEGDSRGGYPDRDMRRHRREEDEAGERNDNDGGYPDRFQPGSYRDRRHYSDIRTSYGEREQQPHRRGGYGGRDRGTYGQGRNRGSFRNSVRRENSGEDVQIGEGKAREEEDNTEDASNRRPANHKQQFSDQQLSYRGGRGHPRRNGGNPYRQNFNDRRDGYGNGMDDFNRDSCPEGNSDVQVSFSHDRDGGQKDDDVTEEGGPKRYNYRNSQEDHPRRYEDRRNFNPQRGGFRDSDRNRQNSDYQNRRNPRYSNDRPFRNKSDSYQYKNNSSRKYNSDQCSDAPYPNTKQAERENSELPCGESSLEKATAEAPKLTKIPSSSSEKEHSLQESFPDKACSGESPCKDVPSCPPVKMPAAVVKPNANFSNSSPKMPHPPPGFSNPMKKVVYGLQAANPPPGFPRS